LRFFLQWAGPTPNVEEVSSQFVRPKPKLPLPLKPSQNPFRLSPPKELSLIWVSLDPFLARLKEHLSRLILHHPGLEPCGVSAAAVVGEAQAAAAGAAASGAASQ
jgi:hypothetical protein